MKKLRPLRKLTNIDPRERSLVDLAANKHRYRIAKRRDPMEDKEQPHTDEDQEKGEGALPVPVEAPPVAVTAAIPADSDNRLQTTIDALNAAIDAMRHRPVAANEDGSVTPPEVQRAALLLAKCYVPLVANEEALDSRSAWRLIEERTRDQSYRMQPREDGPQSGDPEVDGILLRYRRPIAMGAA